MNHYILIWSVCTFVETRIQEKINLDELALQTGFSLAHIRDVFRRNTGKSLSCYIQERKIANAARELLDTDKKIIDIAVQYGYSDRNVFSRAFRRHTGYIPSQFRLEHPTLGRIRLCAGVFGVELPKRQEEPDFSLRSSPESSLKSPPESSLESSSVSSLKSPPVSSLKSPLVSLPKSPPESSLKSSLKSSPESAPRKNTEQSALAQNSRQDPVQAEKH